MQSNLPSPLHSLDLGEFHAHNVECLIKRDDQIHASVMGNKWRKLMPNLSAYEEGHYQGMVTVGGAHSNHIDAFAALCSEYSIPALAMIRGDELDASSTPTLQRAQRLGVQLKFLSRTDYRMIRTDPNLVKKAYPNWYFVPEGGTNASGISGVSEIIEEIGTNFDVIVTAVGTGGTLAGLLQGMQGRAEVWGVSSLKGDFIHKELLNLLNRHQIPFRNYTLLDEYHFGGYGKVNDQLIRFINRVLKETTVLLDPIYTAKALFAVCDKVEKGVLDNKKIVFLHTGGIQGIEGVNRKSIEKIRF